MSRRISCVVFFVILSAEFYAQRSTIELTFTAVNGTEHVQLDKIYIQHSALPGHNTTIYWPDTTLTLGYIPGEDALFVGYASITPLGVPEVKDDPSSFQVYQNFPNPVGYRSEVAMYIPHTGLVQVWVTDLQGRVVLRSERQLAGGQHSFRFTPGGRGLYFLAARWNGVIRSIRVVSTGQQHSGGECQLDYAGSLPGEPALKISAQASDKTASQSGIFDFPDKDTTYIFQFATNIPCPGTPTVEYEGQVYNTIQIFSQCWLKENLNVGVMIADTLEMLNNGIVEKYCASNDSDSCAKYGGMYLWDETMQYTTQEGARGICPPGWHVPRDQEWWVLEGAVDSQYKIGSWMWSGSNWVGYDAGMNLKTTSGWQYNGNGTDLVGFSAMPNGLIPSGTSGEWWSSTTYYDRAWGHAVCWNHSDIYRWDVPKEYGISGVRCLKDY